MTDIAEATEVDGIFLVDSVHRRFTKAQKAYLKLVLADKSGQIESVMWEETMEKNPDSRELAGGDFIDVSGRAGVNRYTNKVEVILNQLRKVATDDLDIADFLPTTDQDIDELKARLKKIVAAVDDPHIKKLLEKLFKDQELSEAYCLAPAAKSYHHGYLGGLLEHSVSVAELALLLCDHYEGIDRSLLIAGALLHDVGKIREFDYMTKIDYSTEGRLKGHIVIGDELVGSMIDGIRGFPADLKLHISHLILSHHGEPEYGAAVRPKTKEAVILNIIDNTDAKINGWMCIAKKYDDDREWTDFQSMFNDYLYLSPVERGEVREEKTKRTKPESDGNETLF